MTGNILIVSEHKDGEVDSVTFELIGKGRELADKLGVRLSVLTLGVGLDPLVAELSGKGVDAILTADDARLEPYTPDAHSKVICDIIKEFQPTLVLFGQTYRGIEMAPAIATKLGVSLASNCLDLEVQGSALFATRPVHQGIMHARVEFQGPHPWVVSVQKGALSIKPYSARKAGRSPTDGALLTML